MVERTQIDIEHSLWDGEKKNTGGGRENVVFLVDTHEKNQLYSTIREMLYHRK